MDREDLESLHLLLGKVRLAPPPTRSETIKEVWRLFGHEFDAKLGVLVCVHHTIPPIVFELIAYDGGKTVIEAEGVVVEHLT